MEDKNQERGLHIANWRQWLMFLLCLLMMAVVALVRDGKLFGYEFAWFSRSGGLTTASAAPTSLYLMDKTSNPGDTVVINTTILGKDIQGFNGPVPLEVTIVDGKVVNVRALPNAETPDFFHRAFNELRTKWNGLTVSQASNLKVDAVSGATYSSNAIIQNVQLALKNYKPLPEKAPQTPQTGSTTSPAPQPAKTVPTSTVTDTSSTFDFHRQPAATAPQSPATSVATSRKSGDTLIVNTTVLGKDIQGYNGPTPVEVLIVDGKVVEVRALENAETPGFFKRAFSELRTMWNGKTVSEASSLKVDAVSGATYSSNAIIQNVQVALRYAQSADVAPVQQKSSFFTPKFIIGLLVVLAASILPLFIKNKTYQIVQMVLNVLVLGLWCGLFVSYTSILTFLSSGFSWAYFVMILMILVAFIYPLFGKKQFYCAHVCPFGALQQLMGYCSKKKIGMSVKLVKVLNWFRRVLWVLLMVCLWTGLFFEWMDYELFTAFLFQTASPVVIGCAVAVALLSIFIPRPYCRFVCPTGTLIKVSEMSL